MANEVDVVSRTFRALVESADRKFARVRDLPQYSRTHNHYFQKVFKAYMRLWKYQQENRSKLVTAGLNRWEIGEIASRIGQLYFNQYMRTSEARFLYEAYVFYEAILERKYFEGGKLKDVGVRFKELRFYARFLVVLLILNRSEMVRVVADKFRGVVEDSKLNFPEINFKEWKIVMREIERFMEVDTIHANARPLRYCVSFDSHLASRPYVVRFHAKKVLKLKEALLVSYHRNEVKFAELTLDTYRMLQCLEWEPSGAFNQKNSIESSNQKRLLESKENGSIADHSVTSGFIDMKLAADLTDLTLHRNPRKAVLYRPSSTHLLAVMATICEELPPESIMLMYIATSGKATQRKMSQSESSGESRKSGKSKASSVTSIDSVPESHSNGKREPNDYYDTHFLLGPRGTSGSNVLSPGDIIPFTRKPLFLIIDSDNSHAFKVLHGAERGETAALLLSHSRSVFKNSFGVETTHNGSQFSFFLTSPLQAFCQMVGCTTADIETDVYNDAEGMLSMAFSEWEITLCTTKDLNIVWAQVLPDPFLRRIILRFIFCRSAISSFCSLHDWDHELPTCLPQLPDAVSPRSDLVQSAIRLLAKHLKVANDFDFEDT